MDLKSIPKFFPSIQYPHYRIQRFSETGSDDVTVTGSHFCHRKWVADMISSRLQYHMIYCGRFIWKIIYPIWWRHYDVIGHNWNLSEALPNTNCPNFMLQKELGRYLFPVSRKKFKTDSSFKKKSTLFVCKVTSLQKTQRMRLFPILTDSKQI